MISPDEEFLTVAEVAERLKLNPQTVRNWIDAGMLPAMRVGRRVRVLRSDLEELLAEGRTDAGAATERPSAEAFWEGEVPKPQLEPDELG